MVRAGLVVFLCLMGSGCVVSTYPLEAPYRPAQAIPTEVSERFRYELETPATLEPFYTDRAADVSNGVLVIRLSQDEEVTPQQFEYWRSHEAQGPAPVVILTPILGGGQGLTRTQCRALTEAGFHVIYAKRGTRVLRETWSVEDLEGWLRRAVAGRMALVDWAQTRPEIDPERVCAFGVSLGGLITTILTGVEPRIHSAVVALAGCDVPRVITISSENRLIRFRETKAVELETDLQGVEDTLRAHLETDPGDAARFIDPRQILQITASLDTVIPPAHQEALWERLGRPLRYDLTASHYSGILYLPYLMAMATRWLDARLSQPAPRQ